MKNAKLGAAVLAGYLLGRTKKAKLALSLGAMVAGSRVKPGQLGKLLEDSPLLGNVSEQVRTELAGASKTAATTLLSAKAENLADALHERTAGLRERPRGGGAADRERKGRDEGEPEGRDEGEREDEEKDVDRDEEREEGEGRGEGRRGGARKSQASRTAGREKTQRRGSDQGGEPRRKKAPAAQSRAKSGSTRSRRPDDG
ncbi:ABC transporter substrate-binding protein [Streptomyces sp. NPDC047079]|uniref:ABC transporter substrate-binding protein n=1 Tax=Streptomyces sp. NPDC047079 TaxID=3154607 RepID=UPI0033DDCAA1